MVHTLDLFRYAVVCVVVCYVIFADGRHTKKFKSKDVEDIPIDEEPKNFNKCCVLESLTKIIGKTAFGKEISMDVGKCKKKCSKQRRMKKKEFRKLMKENPTLNAMEVYLLHSAKREKTSPSCTDDRKCEPSTTHIKRVLTSEGVVSVDVIDDCSCQVLPTECKRQEKFVTLHKDTPLQARVDIGVCSGKCGIETSCKAVGIKTISVEGPNGMECITVTERCECSENCYRSSFYEQHYDYKNSSLQIKVIDVGRCIGKCDSSKESQCVQRNSEEGQCIMSLVSPLSNCVPTNTEFIPVTNDQSGAVRNVTRITHCGCQ